MFVVFTVAQSTFSFQFIVTFESGATSVAPFAGVVELTDGAVLSIVTVLPAPGVCTFDDVSVALLWMVWLPSEGKVHAYVQVTFAPGQPEHVVGCHAPPSMETWTKSTATLSLAVPFMGYGFGELILITAPSAGSVTDEEGIPASAVVYENG